MTTVAILPISNASGEVCYRAIAGDKQCVGKTAGQALDALTTQLGKVEFRAILVIDNFHPDQFFTSEQQQRLSELMNMWRTARDQGQILSPEIQMELDNLVNLELNAATARTAYLAQRSSQ
ncbi:MAG: hypothetical protein ACKO9I_12585 [Sphaerospermopsis kisseleviana]|uniref:Uncharacterized protein n=1 Tax=Sphaerospermopsis reniformis TaxID=531300 RepID=A0A479ZSS1_9CYAN|nr:MULTISPECIES: hypothetical protein [Sphaerospermopsis]MBC5794161.1 hypothetical protein [Sphaerospermopsis sp. LEGE 00249]MBD2131305.1 hypothetical protein [Sphaerospermopsis sp. FACHB-1094]GCL35222.1 hypothetical protein SR1949_03140 [Sphaerospermopsis reniformis]